MNALKKQFAGIVGEDYSKYLVDDLGEKREQMAFEAEIVFSDAENIVDSVKELLENLEGEILKESYRLAMERLKSAEESGNKKDSELLLQRCKDISDQLVVLKDKGL